MLCFCPFLTSLLSISDVVKLSEATPLTANRRLTLWPLIPDRIHSFEDFKASVAQLDLDHRTQT